MRIRELFPQADLKFLDTGHLVQVEAPNEFVKLATEFINLTWHTNTFEYYFKKFRLKSMWTRRETIVTKAKCRNY